MKAKIIWLAVLGLTSCVSAESGYREPPIEEARQCVRQSSGTDWAVEKCYYDRGLPLPQGG